jgi:hypothetical protein
MSVLGRGRVSDPYPFDTDPVRIQHFMLNIDPDPDPIRIQGFDDQKMKKVTAEIFFFSKTLIYISPGPHKGRSSYRRSLQLSKEHPALLNMIFLTFSTFVGHFCTPGSGSGFRIRIRIH